MLFENGGHFVQSSMFKMCYRPTEKIKLVDIPAEKNNNSLVAGNVVWPHSVVSHRVLFKTIYHFKYHGISRDLVGHFE